MEEVIGKVVRRAIERILHPQLVSEDKELMMPLQDVIHQLFEEVVGFLFRVFKLLD